MAMMERPEVKAIDGGKCWEHKYQTFELKVFVPDNDLDGQTNNYAFRAPLLLVFEENKMDMESAVKFAKKTGLSNIAATIATLLGQEDYPDLWQKPLIKLK